MVEFRAQLLLLCWRFTKKFFKYRPHSGNPVRLPGIGATKDETGIDIAALSPVKCRYNTEALTRLRVGAFFQAAHAARGMIIKVVLANILFVV